MTILENEIRIDTLLDRELPITFVVSQASKRVNLNELLNSIGDQAIALGLIGTLTVSYVYYDTHSLLFEDIEDEALQELFDSCWELDGETHQRRKRSNDPITTKAANGNA